MRTPSDDLLGRIKSYVGSRYNAGAIAQGIKVPDVYDVTMKF